MTRNMSDDSLSKYHEVFIDSISVMSAVGSNNPFNMIISQELNNAVLDTITIQNGMAYVEGITFNRLSFENKIISSYSERLNCICIKNCKLNEIDTSIGCNLLAIEDSFFKNFKSIFITHTTYLNNVNSDKPLNLDLTICDSFIANNVELSEFTYDSISSMRKSKNKRNYIVYPFDNAKGLVSSNDIHTYDNGTSNPPSIIRGSFIGKIKEVWIENNMIYREINKLNSDRIHSFAVYTDDPKLLDFLFEHGEEDKYKGISGSMYYLLKKLLSK
jgi:hypothetical protein